MNSDIVIFWMVVFSCLYALLIALTRYRTAMAGWIPVYLSILVVAMIGNFCGLRLVIYLAGMMWLLFVLTPGVLGKIYFKRFLQQRYSAARKLAQGIRVLHPADGWREQPIIIHALEMAQQGEFDAASEILSRFQNVKSYAGMRAVIDFHQLTNRWEELLEWQTRHLQVLERQPSFLPSLLRTRGENGDVRGMMEFYERHRQQIGKLVPPSLRSLCRLPLFAFCGKREALERLFTKSLADLPPSTRAFWLATADMTAGNLDSAKRQFEELLPTVDPPLRRAIERRLSQFPVMRPSLDTATEHVMEEAAKEHTHEESFAGQRSLLSSQARGTQILIILNVLMFAGEIASGGGTNLDTLYCLGAFYGPAVRGGEWWRMIMPLFLHYGWLHITMNMLGLWLLGPFVEFWVGLKRYLFVYLISGIGSLGVVLLMKAGPSDDGLIVGASGCVMGIVGATGALMFRGWQRHKAVSAKRRFAAVLLIVAMQTVFDSVVPQVSMTVHLSGAIIGFVTAMLAGDKLAGTVTEKGVVENAN